MLEQVQIKKSTELCVHVPEIAISFMTYLSAVSNFLLGLSERKLCKEGTG
jgi:hypothetical protein